MKNATPSYWKTNEEIALMLVVLARKAKPGSAQAAAVSNVARRVNARLETHELLGYKPGR